MPSTHSLLRNQGTATRVDMEEVRVILVGEPRSAASDDQAHRDASDKSARLRRARCADLHAIHRFILTMAETGGLLSFKGRNSVQ